jgi:NAD(P)-dependent dehydrogenase (short-subunit alcohol dehydrogenase family)
VLAVEWGKYNINVNSVSPDWTMIPRWEQLAKQHPERFRLDRYPIKRFNKPEDVASAVIFLASSESDNITGQDIIIDSGVNVLWSGYNAPNE